MHSDLPLHPGVTVSRPPDARFVDPARRIVRRSMPDLHRRTDPSPPRCEPAPPRPSRNRRPRWLLVIWYFDVMLDINMIHGCIFPPKFLCFLGNTCFESVETNLLGWNLWLELKFMCCSKICMCCVFTLFDVEVLVASAWSSGIRPRRNVIGTRLGGRREGPPATRCGRRQAASVRFAERRGRSAHVRVVVGIGRENGRDNNTL
jgi:hypothetical protein